MKNSLRNKITRIADIAQLAAVLEVSSFKPGNVDPLHDFSNTKYEDFLSGSIAIRSAIENSAGLGFMAGKGEIPLNGVGIGSNIKKAVSDVQKSHGGGNTHLGIAMLFVPISTGAGVCIAKNFDFKKSLRRNIKKIIMNSTVNDAINFYNAIKIAKAGGLEEKLIEKNIPFYKLMKISAKRDRIAEELGNGMRIIFDIALPSLYRADNIREGITQTYLQILAGFPDTLIAKKVGIEKAKKISRNAKLVLDGKKDIEDFDKELRSENFAMQNFNCSVIKNYRAPERNELNPGTTADIVAASVFVRLIMKEP